MRHVLNGSACTTKAICCASQNSQASVRALVKQCSINPKTVSKWKKQAEVQDKPIGLKQFRLTVLTVEEEALIVTFHRHTLLSLDNCLCLRAARRCKKAYCI
jgi:transposase-like protein